MLKYGEVNPLNVFGMRELKHCPPHFQRVPFAAVAAEKEISDWIYANLDGRFWLGDLHLEDDTQDPIAPRRIDRCAAFEIPAEASFFALHLDQINVWTWGLLE